MSACAASTTKWSFARWNLTAGPAKNCCADKRSQGYGTDMRSCRPLAWRSRFQTTHICGLGVSRQVARAC
jgi:hypothetical protein